MGGEASWTKAVGLSLLSGNKDEDLLQASHASLPQGDNEDFQNMRTPLVRVDLDHDEVLVEEGSNMDIALSLPYLDDLVEKLREIFYPGLHYGLDADYPGVMAVERRGNLFQNGFVQPEQIPDSQLDDKIRNVFFEWFVRTFDGLRSFFRPDGRFDQRRWLDSKPEQMRSYYSVNAWITCPLIAVEILQNVHVPLFSRDQRA